MKNTSEKLITKSFQRLLNKGIHRGFITYEELGKSLGKRHYSQENIEKAFLYIFDNKICLVEKKSDYRLIKKRQSTTENEKEIVTMFTEIMDEIKKIDLQKKIESLENKVSLNLDEKLYSELLSLRNQLKGG